MADHAAPPHIADPSSPPFPLFRRMVKKENRSRDVISREYTVNIHKATHGKSFKEKAPQAVKQIRAFAAKMMGTTDVRIDVKLNKAVWSKGVKNVPNRVRIVVSRRRNDDEDAKVRGKQSFRWPAGSMGVIRGEGMHAGHTGLAGTMNARGKRGLHAWLYIVSGGMEDCIDDRKERGCMHAWQHLATFIF